MAAVMAAISSSVASTSVIPGMNRIAIADIIDIPITNTVRNTKTVPMPTSMSVIP